jgi:predicted phage-related endonuclease
VDGFIFLEHAGFEAKNTGAYFEKDWAEGNIPQEYWIQCQWYMMVCKAGKWYIAVLIGGNYFKWYAIDRNEEVISNLREEAVKFWNENVLKKIPPETQGGNAETNFLNDLFYQEQQGQEENEEVLELEDKAEKDILKLETIKEEIKVLKQKQQQIENKFKIKMAGKYCLAQTKKYEIIYENTKAFDEEKFKQEQQETYRQFILEQFDLKTFKEKSPKLYADYCVMPKGKKFKIKKKK